MRKCNSKITERGTDMRDSKSTLMTLIITSLRTTKYEKAALIPVGIKLNKDHMRCLKNTTKV